MKKLSSAKKQEKLSKGCKLIYHMCGFLHNLWLNNGLNVLQMRLNKVSELIHNSTNHQNLDSAGVSVHFQEIIDLVTNFHLLCFLQFCGLNGILWISIFGCGVYSCTKNG